MSLNDQLNEERAEGWRPEEGAVLIGRLQSIGAGWSDYQNRSYPILTVLDEAQEGKPVEVHCFHAVLLNRLLELKPRVGERIALKYKGKEPSKDGKREVSIYVVKVEGRDVEVSWGTFQEGASRQAPQTDVPVDTQDFLPQGQQQTDDDIPF